MKKPGREETCSAAWFGLVVKPPSRQVGGVYSPELAASLLCHFLLGPLEIRLGFHISKFNQFYPFLNSFFKIL